MMLSKTKTTDAHRTESDAQETINEEDVKLVLHTIQNTLKKNSEAVIESKKHAIEKIS